MQPSKDSFVVENAVYIEHLLNHEADFETEFEATWNNHTGTPDCWCCPIVEYPEQGVTVYIHRKIGRTK